MRNLCEGVFGYLFYLQTGEVAGSIGGDIIEFLFHTSCFINER